MTLHLNTQADLEQAIHVLVKQDPRLKPIFEVAGMPALRRREPGFAGLAAIVSGQQLSTASAAAIWGRLEKAFAPFDHHNVLRARTPQLQRAERGARPPPRGPGRAFPLRRSGRGRPARRVSSSSEATGRAG